VVEALGRPSAYPHPAVPVEVHHTHISVVFLAGDFAYKVKKPVDLGFLDFTTLERRRRYCRQEVLLNRRLAPDVYLGVAPLVRMDGDLRLGPALPPGEEPDPGSSPPGGAGTVVEYVVKMRRLPEDATLRQRLHGGELEEGDLASVARRIARFHREAASGPEISAFGRWDVVAGNAMENFDQTVDHVGQTVSGPVHDRLRRLTRRRLEEIRPLVADRAERDVPRDTHGDLHLDHVYLFPDREPPDDLVVLDCIEFNERFRYGDPVSDVGFLVMDLAFEGRRDLADAFADAWVRASGDDEGRRLLPFYTAYRAAVRGKVEGMAASDEAVPGEERRTARQKARAHWLLALGELAPPDTRPCLVLVGGLPGTGKTTLSRGLADAAGFHVVSSDRTRKALAGVDPDEDAAAGFEEGIYTPEWTERTYEACREAAEEALFLGERVLVDASFREEGRRRAFHRLGRRWGVPVLWLLCRAPASTVRSRLRGERTGSSDADWRIHRRVAERWDDPGPETRRILREVATDGPPGEAVEAALAHLRAAGLHDGG
jgi:aminoglycoside phosphotransferase family enzyme/predicted kinase